MPTFVTQVMSRVYADFVMPPRVSEYADLLRQALVNGFETVSVYEFWKRVVARTAPHDTPILVLRHDIDTDPHTARRLYECESRLGCKSSFFFRLCTLDLPFMRELHAAGYDASYHYEEVATVAKREGLSSAAQVLQRITYIRRLFLNNLTELRASTGLPMRCVASHGDFVNRRLGLTNRVILEDTDFRRTAAIDVEAYDPLIVDRMSARFSDRPYPDFWIPEHPLSAISQRMPVVQILTHPRQWHTARVINAIDDARRLVDGVQYRFRAAMRTRRVTRGIAAGPHANASA